MLYNPLSLAFARQLPRRGEPMGTVSSFVIETHLSGKCKKLPLRGSKKDRHTFFVQRSFFCSFYHSRMTLMTPSALSRASSR